MKKSSGGKKEGDYVNMFDEKIEEPHIVYRRTSKSHKIDWCEAVDGYHFVEEDPFNKMDSTPERCPRVSFSSLDEVKVFYPDQANLLNQSKSKGSRKSVEENIIRIGETSMYKGRLNKRVNVMSPITELSPRITNLYSKTHGNGDWRAKKTVNTQGTGRKIEQLPPLIKTHSRGKEWEERYKTTGGESTSFEKSSLVILPRKFPSKPKQTAAVHTTTLKLPNIIPSKPSSGRPCSHKNQNIQRVKLPSLRPLKGQCRRTKQFPLTKL